SFSKRAWYSVGNTSSIRNRGSALAGPCDSIAMGYKISAVATPHLNERGHVFIPPPPYWPLPPPPCFPAPPPLPPPPNAEILLISAFTGTSIPTVGFHSRACPIRSPPFPSPVTISRFSSTKPPTTFIWIGNAWSCNFFQRSHSPIAQRT